MWLKEFQEINVLYNINQKVGKTNKDDMTGNKGLCNFNSDEIEPGL